MASHEPSITLSEDRGVNPRLTTCTACGKDTQSLALLGDGDWLHDCSSCGRKVLGKKGAYKCPACGARALKRDRRLGGMEKIPMGLCDECEAKQKEAQKEADAVVAQGGIYWRCSDCHSTGAIRAEAELSKMVREKMGTPAPKPVGIEFTKEQCSVCGSEES